MADDIGRPGEYPGDVARRRRRQGIRYRAAQAAANQGSGPTMTPSNQSMVPYQERLPTAPEGGGRGGPPAPSGGREVASPRGENLPAVRREGMPSIRVPPGAAEAMRGAMQSPMARAMGTGRGAAIGRVAEGAMRLGEAARRAYRSMPARTPDTGPDEGPARPSMPIPNNLPDMEPPPYEEARRPRPRQQPARRPSQSEADALNQRELERIALGAVLSDMMKGGYEQPERGFFERLGIRRTNETGEGRPSTGNFREDIRELGRTLGFKKGGQIKSKTMMKKGGKVMKYREGGPIRQGMQSPKAQEGRAEMAEDVMRRERAREPISDKARKAARMEAGMDSGPLTDAEKERMRSSGFKKGGAIKAPAKKMKSGGKVPAPKKMMKGGKVAAKPVKKMMGGGRAMYAKGGMAKGCK